MQGFVRLSLDKSFSFLELIMLLKSSILHSHSFASHKNVKTFHQECNGGKLIASDPIHRCTTSYDVVEYS